MQNRRLAADHVRRASARLLALDTLFDAQSWADVVREAQEVVELALKGLLRISGVAPPPIHDVGDVLIAERARLPASIEKDLPRLVEISHEVRRDFELAFEGAEDLIPSNFYKKSDAIASRDGARFVVEAVRPHTG